MNKNILVTGAAGMIGANLINDYLTKDKKNKIFAIDSLILGKKEHLNKNNQLKFFKKDLSKKFNSIKISKKIIFNEIWLLSANSDILKGSKNLQIDLNNTFLSVFNTLKFFSNSINKKTKIIFSSSSAIYGQANIDLTEKNLNFKPESNYGTMKLCCEIFIKFFCLQKKCSYRIFRFPNVIGKYLTHGVIFDFNKKRKNKKKIFKILGNGYQKKPYSYASEIVQCMIKLSKKKEKSLIFNIGPDDKGITVRDIVKIFYKEFNIKKKPEYQKSKKGWVGDVTNYNYSTKLQKKNGFKFKNNSYTAIKKTLKYLQ